MDGLVVTFDDIGFRKRGRDPLPSLFSASRPGRNFFSLNRDFMLLPQESARDSVRSYIKLDFKMKAVAVKGDDAIELVKFGNERFGIGLKPAPEAILLVPGHATANPKRAMLDQPPSTSWERRSVSMSK
jgi:hypothetical protein